MSPMSVKPTEVDHVDQEWSAVHTITCREGNNEESSGDLSSSPPPTPPPLPPSPLLQCRNEKRPKSQPESLVLDEELHDPSALVGCQPFFFSVLKMGQAIDKTPKMYNVLSFQKDEHIPHNPSC